ncbi:MAG: hypothetical protein IIB03_06960, partial [Acidobacteria bacterium]|nr:hypothetical protein [Acidobacteriota bacterium]
LSHKVIDVVAPLDRFNAHTFLYYAAKELRAAKSANLEPWVVGGTGLYIRALVANLDLGSHPRPRLRTAIGRLLEKKPPGDVAQHVGVGTADDSNPVRVARAIENALIAFAELVNDPEVGKIRFLIDNTTAMYSIKRGRSRHYELNWVINRILKLLPDKECTIAYITTTMNKKFADPISRGDAPRWELASELGAVGAEEAWRLRQPAFHTRNTWIRTRDTIPVVA